MVGDSGVGCGRGFVGHCEGEGPMNMPGYPTTQPKVKSGLGQPQPVMTKEEPERLERQLIPTLNSVRAALGKLPIIVPKG